MKPSSREIFSKIICTSLLNIFVATTFQVLDKLRAEGRMAEENSSSSLS